MFMTPSARSSAARRLPERRPPRGRRSPALAAPCEGGPAAGARPCCPRRAARSQRCGRSARAHLGFGVPQHARAQPFTQPRYVEKIGFGALGGSLSLVPQRAAIMPAISARVWPTSCCSRM